MAIVSGKPVEVNTTLWFRHFATAQQQTGVVESCSHDSPLLIIRTKHLIVNMHHNNCWTPLLEPEYHEALIDDYNADIVK